jgi:hypothetical protein
MSFDIFEKLDDDGDKRPKKKPGFDTGLGGLTSRQVAQATESKSMAGQYKRWTVTLPPGQIEVIKEAAEAEGMSTLAFVRWLIDAALAAYEDGERPKIVERVVRGEAEKSHWSSQQ